ncbi:hypothetical protein OOU_Y34scaffold00690g3 [Pyricularia oryzae Y34]|nr:hypothetical protein OOU_Y34scaffold00690g3 [Pyricularia oryzae Y34]
MATTRKATSNLVLLLKAGTSFSTRNAENKIGISAIRVSHFQRQAITKRTTRLYQNHRAHPRSAAVFYYTKNTASLNLLANERRFSGMSVITQATAMLAKRADGCPDGYYRSGNYCYRGSGWYWWGRWVLTAVVLIGIIVIIMLIARTSARRRRARGMAPIYGTGWVGPKPAAYQNNQNNPNTYYPPPPQYSANPQQPQYTGTAFNPNDGYYGGQQSGVQPPANTYVPPQNNATPAAGGDNYAPPPGPPPGK